jgi:hypothetical protein
LFNENREAMSVCATTVKGLLGISCGVASIPKMEVYRRYMGRRGVCAGAVEITNTYVISANI